MTSRLKSFDTRDNETQGGGTAISLNISGEKDGNFSSRS